MRLLVVEDESQLQQQLAQGLSKHGYVVDVAEDGKTGLYYATEYDFDAAIIDIGLPECGYYYSLIFGGRSARTAGQLLLHKVSLTIETI